MVADVMEWSDLRIFLAIARTGTLGAAARHQRGQAHRALLDLVIERLAN